MFELERLLNANPQLESINLDYENIQDLTLCMKYLKKFPKLRSLSLHGNKLKIIPLLHDLKELKNLDLTQNKLKIDGFLLDSLFSLPKLQKLQIDGTDIQLERILENLPNLLILNGKQVIRKQNNVEQQQRRKKTVQMYELARNQLIQLHNEIMVPFQIKNTDFVEFDFVYKDSRQELKQFLNNVSHDQTKQGVFYNSKKKMLDVITQKTVETMQSNGFESCANALNKIAYKQRQYFDAIFKVILQIGYAENYLEKEFSQQTNSELKNVKLRKQRLYLKQIMRLKKLVSNLKYQINKLEEQNHRYIGIIYGNSVEGMETQIRQNRKRMSQEMDHEPQFFNLQTKFKNQNQKQKEDNERNKSPTPSRVSLTPSKSQPVLKSKGGTQEFKDQVDKGASLTIEQTLNLVDQIIKKKQVYNKRCVSKKQTFETAQEFLSLFFTQKYGLKTLAINSSISFLKALQTYSKTNTELEVFLKILKNKLEQSFYQDHKEFVNKTNYKLPIYFRKTIKNGSKFNVPLIFKHYFPQEAIENYQLTYTQEISKIQELQILKRELHRIHILIHENQISEFLEMYQRYDRTEDGTLKTREAHELVLEFFKSKIKEGNVQETILDQINKKFSEIDKPKLVFSEIVQIVDKI